MTCLAVLFALLGPAAAPPRDEGRAYLEVGEAELRAGNPETAAIALRRAARLLADSRRVAAALGTAYARLGRLAEAEAELERALALGDDRPSTSLELGIVRVRRGRHREARDPLRRARERAADPAVRAAARFFEALAELRDGHEEAARRGFAEVERMGGPLAEPARRMSEVVRPRPRLRFSLSLRGDYDTNALLLPGTPSTIPLPKRESDEALVLGAGFRGRPLAGVDLVLRNDVVYREQRSVNELDLLGNVAGIDYRHQRAARDVSAGYQLEYYRLAGRPYLFAHRMGAGYEHRVSEGVRIGATLALQVRRFQQAAFEPFSGEGYQGRFAVSLLGPPSAFAVETGYAPSLEVTDERDLGFHGHAFFAALSWQPREAFGVSIGAEVALRFFLAADEVLGETRREAQPLVWASMTLRPARPLRLVLSASYTDNGARPSFYAYDRFQVSLATILDIDAL